MKVLRKRKKFGLSQSWYSICSKHMYFNPNCNLCRSGHYTYDWKVKASQWFYKKFPTLWKWWANK